MNMQRYSRAIRLSLFFFQSGNMRSAIYWQRKAAKELACLTA
ncbi:hypothetical protein [Marispirochaeta aestuarii]|nr:hypothetical protein [Marispirochaeta aestuarii]